MSSLSVCRDFVISSWDSVEGRKVTEFIQSNPSPTEFDEFTNSIAGYRLDMHHNTLGVSACHAAVFFNNCRLVRHIYKLGGDRILNLGDVDGFPPIFSSITLLKKVWNNAKCFMDESRILMVKLLVEEFHINLNICAVNGANAPSFDGYIPRGVSVLWVAARNKNVGLVKYLMRHGLEELKMEDEYRQDRFYESQRGIYGQIIEETMNQARIEIEEEDIEESSLKEVYQCYMDGSEGFGFNYLVGLEGRTMRAFFSVIRAFDG